MLANIMTSSSDSHCGEGICSLLELMFTMLSFLGTGIGKLCD